MKKTILLIGAMGAGKSTLLGIGYRTLAAHWGRTATIDTDAILTMIDPRSELPEDERYELCGYQCWLLAKSFLTGGFECVVIGSIGFHAPEEGLNDMIDFLLSVGEVYHVTLDTSLEEIQRRVDTRGGGFSSEAIAEHVEWMRARYRDWSCRIDNTSMTPEETIAAIADRIGRGEGRVTGPLPT